MTLQQLKIEAEKLGFTLTKMGVADDDDGMRFDASDTPESVLTDDLAWAAHMATIHGSSL